MSRRIEHPRDYSADSRRRRWLIIAAAGVLVIAVVAYFQLRDNGESNRAAYCNQLETFVGDNSTIQAAASSADKAGFDAVIELAPSAVQPAWDGLAEASLTKDPSASQQEIFDAKLGPEVDKIAQDARASCSLSVDP